MKVCAHCLEEKPATAEFFPAEGGRLRGQCKPCRASQKRVNRRSETAAARERRLAQMREYGAAYKETNAAALRESKAKWRRANPEYDKERYRANADEVKVRASEWRRNNLERKRASNQAWALANPDKANEASRKCKRRRRSSSQVRLFESVSEQMRVALRGGKDGRSWECLVGFTRAQLIAHLERQFRKGMSWANYDDWHIDHIVPASSFKYETADDDDFKACWALTNLRPLWAAENIRKRDRRLFLL